MGLSSRVILLLFLIFNSFSDYAGSLDCREKHCVAVVDAGSTGSRLHVYSYDVDETNTPIHISEKWSKKIKPGFASIEGNQATIDAYLTSLFSDVSNVSLPVFFYATAGMRLLPQPLQQQRYDYLKNWFHNQSQWTLIDARTITGSEEGLFDWLSVNYQLGNLNSEDKNTAGVMDMGGASVQIIFPVPNNMAGSGDIKDVTVYGRHFTIFIHSFLGLGQTEVTHQFLNSNYCFITDYLLPDGLNASGDAYRCKKAVLPLMKNVHHVNRIVHPAIEATPATDWYVMGGVADLVKSKPFNFPNSQFTNEELLVQADTEVCRQQWSSLQNQYPDNDYLYGYCLFPAYYYALMVEGYGLGAKQPVHIMNENQSADWTMGVVLHQPS
ncbi:multidrug DMT transporter permease [Legionella spiritensis]|uniref:multidrug DMT transporter permease n=1 Tax=Legionella spiritensis TaxID=452 RepID=UPI000F7110A4|nr:multidrug DMT transporter permease [Legionella spiritensis]VEG89913.1 ectonucleoside triphosphate diphosphohydrolase I [Legionella spiritensis]